MKKLIAAIAVVGVFAGVALADVVTSVNIVGYKKHALVGGKIYLISTQFESIDGSPVTPETAIGDQLPVGSKLWYWNAKKLPSAGYEQSERVDTLFFQGWNGTVTLDGTRGFWVQPGGPAGVTNEVAFLGEVPLREDFTNVIAEAITMTAFPYTADIAFNQTAIYNASATGDKMWVWDPDGGVLGNGAYKVYEKVDTLFFTGWNNSGESLILSQGTGIWYDRAGAGDLVIADIRPYNP